MPAFFTPRSPIYANMVLASFEIAFALMAITTSTLCPSWFESSLRLSSSVPALNTIWIMDFSCPESLSEVIISSNIFFRLNLLSINFSCNQPKAFCNPLSKLLFVFEQLYQMIFLHLHLLSFLYMHCLRVSLLKQSKCLAGV